MEKFLFIIREDLKKIQEYNESQKSDDMRLMHEWTEWLIESGNYVDSNPLKTSGRYVSRDSIISDGPFIESKEGVSGYYLIRAESLEQAVSIAQDCPLLKQGLAVVEVRPLDVASDT
jgi:hypothetical protein